MTTGENTATRRPSASTSWLLFFGFLVICLGLGYATLNRYDPREIGNVDSWMYYNMIVGQPVNAPAAYRPLVPMLARGVLCVVSRFELGTWEPVFLSLLIVNSVFSALTALLLMRMAAALGHRATVALVAPLVYLSSYVVVNHHLAGLVDSAEAFFLVALLLALLQKRRFLAPILIAAGAVAKETIVPFGICAMVVWWAVERIRGEKESQRQWSLTMGASLAAGLIVLAACRYLVDVPPYEKHALSVARLEGFFARLIACVGSRYNLYAFAFLLPMGIPRLRSIPAPLLAASAAMALLATLLGAYAEIGNNLYRPLFNTAGPVLVLSSSIFVADLVRGRRRDAAGEKG